VYGCVLNGIGQPDPAVDEDSSLPVNEYVSHGSFTLYRVSALARVRAFIAVHLGEDLQPLTAAVAFTKREALHRNTPGEEGYRRLSARSSDFCVAFETRM
jgi:hypothetical protein